MSSATRLSLGALAACVAAAVVFVAPVPAATPLSLCASLSAWAEQTYRGASPTLDEIATFDRAHRLAIFTVVTPEVRAALWKDQLGRAAARTDLTSEQRALFVEAQTFMTPALYTKALKSRSEMSEAMREFSARTKAAFTSREHLRLLADIGAAAGAAATTPPSAWERISRRFSKSAQTDWCECSDGSEQYDCWGVACIGVSCMGREGCGLMGNFYCQGMCNW